MISKKYRIRRSDSLVMVKCFIARLNVYRRPYYLRQYATKSNKPVYGVTEHKIHAVKCSSLRQIEEYINTYIADTGDSRSMFSVIEESYIVI